MRKTVDLKIQSNNDSNLLESINPTEKLKTSTLN